MERDELTAKLASIAKEYWLPLLLATFGFIFLIYGLISLLGSSQKSEELQFRSSSNTQNVNNISAIVIDMEGEVVAPGVYTLKEGSIVQDALVASKGMTANADRVWVAKNINLALKLSDGQKIYIPKQKEKMN